MSKNTKIFLSIGLTIIVLLLIIAFIFFKNLRLNDVDGDLLKRDTDHAPKIGDKNAPNIVVEFMDFKCPYCKKFDQITLDKLYKKHIKADNIQYRVINASILGKDSTNGARAAYAVKLYYPKKYWEFHHRIFELQPNHENKWITNKLIDEELSNMNIPKDKLKKIKLDYKTKGSKSWKLANKDKNLYKKYKNDSVPSVYVNGHFVKTPYQSTEIEKLLKN